MFKRYFENVSWVDIFLKLFQVLAIIVIVYGIYNTVVAAKYTSAQWATLVFAGGSLFGLAFAAMCVSIAVTGKFSLRKHPPAMAGSAWAFTVIVITMCLVTAPTLSDPAVGNRMLLSGLVFFIMAAVFLLASRTEQSELNLKEKLLEIEYRLAELTEKVDSSRRGS